MKSTAAAADPTQTPSRPAKFLSRVTTPFASRKRSHAEFYIEPDEPYRQYSPGDRIKGCVNIKVDKAVNITHLVVCLHGFVKVFNNAKLPGQNVPRDGAPLGTGNGSSKKGSEYFGNGFASLFEDEVVLCGQGRLLPSTYRFKFELELPLEGLPSSIDFERGTISYMLTSTLTKPTTISPKSSCHWKIKVVEGVDIAGSQQPKPKVVSLEPVSKGIKSKGSATPVKSIGTAHQGVTPTVASAELRSSGDPPQSPAHSDTSSISATSSSGSSWQIRSSTSIAKSASEDKEPGKLGGINATIEVLRGGCLPGDSLPVQVSVNHTKAVKSLQGIIITLYRLARVDTHPAIPLGPRTENKKPEYEDYYPKSRTGLGGLSLTSAGSSRAFRQDLNQTFAPLIVDPRSLTAVIKTSLQVPEDLFPTISNVPGQMISFKYYVEVVVDLRGKLASQDRVLSQLAFVNGAGGYGHGDPQVNGVDGSSGLVFPLASGFGCLDTSQMRREKSVVSWPFEVLVGTRDSDRKRCKISENLFTPDTESARQIIPLSGTGREEIYATGGQTLHTTLSSPHRVEPDGYLEVPQHLISSPQYTEAAQTAIIPPPEEETDEGDEKSRLRRAEQRLLPSEPLLDGEQVSSSIIQPSAPEAIDDEDFVNRYRIHQPVAQGHYTTRRGTIVPSSSHGRTTNAGCRPVLPPRASVSNNDKQEHEMQRLQEEASSPEVSADPAVSLEPTAPILYENSFHEVHSTPTTTHEWPESEHLPMYRK